MSTSEYLSPWAAAIIMWPFQVSIAISAMTSFFDPVY